MPLMKRVPEPTTSTFVTLSGEPILVPKSRWELVSGAKVGVGSVLASVSRPKESDHSARLPLYSAMPRSCRTRV